MRRLAQYCINVTDLERAEAFYCGVLGLNVVSRIEVPGASELVLAGSEGDTRMQLAQQHGQQGPIEHGNALWKIYLYTDDCSDLYQRAVAAGAEALSYPVRLEDWPVTVAFIKDPDGYTLQLLERHV